MASMEKAGIKKLSIKEKTGYELHLERHEEHVSQTGHPASFAAHPPAALFSQHHFKPHEHPPHFPVHHAPAPSQSEERGQVSVKKEEKLEGRAVTAPMVGTFYTAPSPDDPPFVKVGDRVDENTVVCIIEAMKVMNEVKAGISGVVAEVCLDTGHPVEFGTKLFRIV